MRKLPAIVCVCLLMAGSLAISDLLWPEATPALTAENGPVQNLQALFLVTACLAVVVRLSRSRVPRTDSASLAALGLLAFALAWREIELDEQLWHVHAFSWKYLFNASIPASVRWGLGIPSLLLTAGAAAYLLRSGVRTWCGRLWAWRSCGLNLVLCGLFAMAAGQLWDKGRTIARHCGIQLFQHREEIVSPNPLPEELLELIGEFLLLMGILGIIRRRDLEEGTVIAGAGPAVEQSLPRANRMLPETSAGLNDAAPWGLQTTRALVP